MFVAGQQVQAKRLPPNEASRQVPRSPLVLVLHGSVRQRTRMADGSNRESRLSGNWP
jgi:hypothetical protein